MTNLQSARDSTLQASVVEELSWVPDVDSTKIGVAVDDGIVTLLGEVSSYAEKVRAAKAALHVHGVRGIAQEITVRSPWGLTDADVAKNAEGVLEASVDVPETVHVIVDDRVVTLSGETHWQFQRMAAEHAVEHLRGVQGVLNLTTIKKVPVPADMARRITAAFVRSADLDSRSITITTDEHGVVTLRGSVKSAAERRSAARACWSSPGVTRVHDELRVSA